MNPIQRRSGELPPSQRMTWRKDSALRDGFQIGVDLVGGYYDAGDNVKFNFPMAFSTTMLAWSVLEFGGFMGSDYFLKVTSIPGFVFIQVGEPYNDHKCWERPEDMDTLRTTYAVSKNYPGSEASGEIAAALAASSLVFKPIDLAYSARLLKRARWFLNLQTSTEDHIMTVWGHGCAPFIAVTVDMRMSYGSFAEFGWDTKYAGINVLISKLIMTDSAANSYSFVPNADKFVCSVLPESPTVDVSYSPGGLIFKSGGRNLQHATASSFLFLVYGCTLSQANRVVHCGNIVANSERLIQFARSQVDYILGSNPLGMSYMVGYGRKFPQRIHHRASSLPSVNQHPEHIDCNGGSSYYNSNNLNPNLLIGAVVGGPDIKDSYADSRSDFVHSEPTTCINAPFVGLLAYFK
ncbi:hypothetical protein SLA2020_154780 [Shorea laevis]